MTVLGPIWDRYEQMMRGERVSETGDFEWMLEEPDEFELRVLVRHFDEREESLERIGKFELDPPGDYSDEQVEQLVRSTIATYREIASTYMPDVLGAPAATCLNCTGVLDFLTDDAGQTVTVLTGANRVG